MRLGTEMLETLLAEETRQPVPLSVRAAAEALVRPGVAAILFYGSGLWKGIDEETVLDFYVLCDDLAAYGLPWPSRLAAKLLPPNVYAMTIPDAGRAKVAVMTMESFAREAAGHAATPQIWARFAQPCRIVFSRDAGALEQTHAALAAAVGTFIRETSRVVQADSSAKFWTVGFRATLGYELRSENADRAAAIYEASPAAYDARLKEVGVSPVSGYSPSRLRLRQYRGKAIHLLRLMKASFTYAGGIDYLLWKIARHSGVAIVPNEFQRRHPLIGGWPLLWRLWRRGGFR